MTLTQLLSAIPVLSWEHECYRLPDTIGTMALATAAANADTAFSSIPIIDLGRLRSDDALIKQTLAEEIRDACMNVGFFYVKGHGIPEPIVENALLASKSFFSLSLDKKMTLDMRKPENRYKGYNPLLSSKNDGMGGGDMHEGFEFGWEENAEDIGKETNMKANLSVNVWPSDVPGFRGAVLSYYHAAIALGKSLFPLFALALGLPESFFDDKTQNSAALMRVLHYPPQIGPMDDRTIGIGAHTDFECFTILWQEPDIQSLQVLNAKRQWINAPPIPGTLVINLGDQFARWTNDVFKSTVHRAINRSGVRRYSIPLFFGTDYDVLLEPLPSCVSPDRPPKYEPILAGDYVKARLAATYGH